MSERRPAWRRGLVVLHRWLGIAGGVLFAAWFVSGIVMMYAGMPSLSQDERLSRMPPLDPAAIAVTPEEAARSMSVDPVRVRLSTFAGRPVYRLFDGRWLNTVFADDGRPLPPLTATDAEAAARGFAPEHVATVRHNSRLVDADQWTFSVRAQMPLHRVTLGDPDGSVLYISEDTGEVAMKTTRSTRRIAYLGAVLHWIYFTPLRRQAGLWTQVIIWTSLFGCLLTLSGLVVGITSPTTYAGWLRWHHYGGLMFGFFTFTWVFSGLLSVDPWAWHPGTGPTRDERELFSGGPVRLDAVTVEQLQQAIGELASDGPKELDFVQFLGEPFLSAGDRVVSLVAPERGPAPGFDRDLVGSLARSLKPGAALADAVWLDRYDAYYYDRSGRLALPVLRVRYADPRRTWFYVNPWLGTVVRREERLTRLNRWLYHGFHSLDFPFLYYRRPLWDVVVILLSLGGLFVSVTTMVPGWRRLRRHARRLSGN